jgi:hypothetical protein
LKPKFYLKYLFFIDEINGRPYFFHKHFDEKKELILLFSGEFEAHHFSFLIFDSDIDCSTLRVQKTCNGLKEYPFLLGLLERQVVIFELDEHAL